MHIMVESLRELASKLGLHALGIAPATDEVRRAYPWAQSVVSAAVSYLPPDRGCEDDAPRGLVARFACGADYHQVLRTKLNGLAAEIARKRPGAPTEVCVDACSLPERKLAVLAGIARRGKNANVFVDGCGSYVSLGEIVTGAWLPADEPHEADLCGDCDECMRACPTGAIIAPYTIDRARCLSHLTQVSGVIPVGTRTRIGSRVYGCDVCQEVCPHNAGLQSVTKEFAAEVFPGAYPELLPLIDISAEEFACRVRHSSIGWIGRTRLRRNAAVAAGNLKSESAVPALVSMLGDGNTLLRIHAAWALARIASVDALKALRDALSKERDQRVEQEIRASLPRFT